MATGNRHKNLVKIGNAVFELCAHTDTKQTSEYFASLPGGGGAVTLSHLWNTRDAQQSPLCEYVTSSTKPEVHNVLQRPQSQMRIEPRPQATCTKFGEVCHVVFSARCIIYNSRLCYVVSVRLSVCL